MSIEISNGWLLFQANDSDDGNKFQPKLLRLADYIYFDVRPAPPEPGNMASGKYQLIAFYEMTDGGDLGYLLHTDLEEECLGLLLGIWDAIKKDAPVIVSAALTEDTFEEMTICGKDGINRIWRRTSVINKETGCHVWEEVIDA